MPPFYYDKIISYQTLGVSTTTQYYRNTEYVSQRHLSSEAVF